MTWTRRKFFGAGAAVAGLTAAGGSWWLRVSKHRSARMLRQLLHDARRSVAPAPLRPRPATWPTNGITVCWLGHSTVLINFYGVRILTDPVFSTWIGVNMGLATLGPKRYVAPALTFAQLPPVDVVLLSHAHRDHLDLPSLERFPSSTFAVTARATRDLLAATPLRRAISLGWADQTTFKCGSGDLRIEAFEVKHWGRRWPSEQERGYNGYLLTREGRTLLFAGDTAYTTLFAKLRPRGPFDLAIMPIAAYNPWIRNHCTPEEAVTMADLAGARFIVPVHHQTFKLSDEPLGEPLARLQAALRTDPARLALGQIGQSLTLP
jgi:L-ascorbate metabolism protein UlaG (beta-lactamase superfamily)